MDYQRRAYNNLAFMGLKPMISETNYFPAYEISKESLKNSGFDGIQTHNKIFYSF